MEEEDDFWDSSQVKAQAFNFEDDQSHEFSKLGAELRADLGKSASAGVEFKTDKKMDYLIPLENVISEKALETILLASSGEFPSGAPKASLDVVEPNISITLKRLVLGRTCSLHHHKSLKSKTRLLDGAIVIGDGNVILKVVLFLVQTLNKKLLQQILSSRAVAANHYINYLITRMKLHEVTDLLTMLGRSGEAAIKQFQATVGTSSGSIDTLLKNLNHLKSNHFNNNSVDAIQLKMITNYIQLLEWQKSLKVSDVENKSAIQCLAYSCIHHWGDGGKLGSPQSLCQEQQISSQQYDWTALSVQASLKNWPVIETMFIKKNFLGRATFSCNIPTAKLIMRLHELHAGSTVMATYLNQITSVGQRLELAKKYKVHEVVIDCFVSQKDRQALTQYKMTLHPQSEEYFRTENALRSITVKWKN